MNGWQLTLNESLRFRQKYREVWRNHMWTQLKAPLYTPWRHIGGVEVELHSFLASALRGREWFNFTLRLLDLQEITPVPIKWEGWVGPTAGLEVLEKSLLPLLGFEPRIIYIYIYIYIYVCVCVCLCIAEHRLNVSNLDLLNCASRHVEHNRMLLPPTAKSTKHHQQRTLAKIRRLHAVTNTCVVAEPSEDLVLFLIILLGGGYYVLFWMTVIKKWVPYNSIILQCFAYSVKLKLKSIPQGLYRMI